MNGNGSPMAKQITIDPNRIGRTGHKIMGGIEALEAWVGVLGSMHDGLVVPEDVTPEDKAKFEFALEKQREVLDGLGRAMTANLEALKHRLMQIGKERGAISIGSVIVPGRPEAEGTTPIEVH